MLHELGDVTIDEMVLSFLREIDSREYGAQYADALKVVRWDRSILIDNADLSDGYANCARTIVLSLVRGFGRNLALFDGFPMDTKWRRVSFGPPEFHRLRHVGNEAFWRDLTEGTRLPEDSARNYKNTPIEAAIDGILEGLRRGDPMPEIILVEDRRGRLIVLEGNRRVTAFAIAQPDRVFALLGTSPTMDQWPFI